MVMAGPRGMTKVASWDELVLSDLVIHGGNLQLRMAYAYVRRSDYNGIRPPASHVGVRILREPEPYGNPQSPLTGVSPGEPVVLVRFRTERHGWTHPMLQRAQTLGLVPSDERDPQTLDRVCIPYYRLGMLCYER